MNTSVFVTPSHCEMLIMAFQHGLKGYRNAFVVSTVLTFICQSDPDLLNTVENKQFIFIRLGTYVNNKNSTQRMEPIHLKVIMVLSF